MSSALFTRKNRKVKIYFGMFPNYSKFKTK